MSSDSEALARVAGAGPTGERTSVKPSTNRQTAVRTIAATATWYWVIGSAASSNSRCLAEVALTAGAQQAYLLDQTGDLRQEWLADVTIVRVTAGASGPEELVTDLLTALADRGLPHGEARHHNHRDCPLAPAAAANPEVSSDSTVARAQAARKSP